MPKRNVEPVVSLDSTKAFLKSIKTLDILKLIGFVVLLGIAFNLLVFAVFSIVGIWKEGILQKFVQIGGAMGSLSALLTAFTLIFVVVGLIEQARDRDRQSFENHFFALIGRHEELTGAIAYRYHQPDGGSVIDSQGKRAFEYLSATFFELLQAVIRREIPDLAKGNPQDEDVDETLGLLKWAEEEAQADRAEAFIREAFDDFYRRRGHLFGYYYRSFYRFIEYIKDSTGEDSSYVALVRAPLSIYEICMLAGNGLSTRGRDFFDFITRYRLLSGLPRPENWRQEFGGEYTGESGVPEWMEGLQNACTRNVVEYLALRLIYLAYPPEAFEEPQEVAVEAAGEDSAPETPGDGA